MKHYRFVAVAVLAGLVPGSRADDAAKRDQEKLQGTWVLVSGAMEGEKLPEEEVKKAPKVVLVFAGDTVTLHKCALGPKAAPQVVLKGTFKLHPARTPKDLDIVVTEDIGEGLAKGQTVAGIYELAGDTLKWCAPEPGVPAERPAAFATKPGSKHMLSVLRGSDKTYAAS